MANEKRLTITALHKAKTEGRKLCMVTAYDATFARIADDAGTDLILVGDSLGMVVQGHESTLPVTMEHMIYHCQAVMRGAKRAHIVGDLPFRSYQGTVDEAVANAGRLVAEGGVGSVKLEGGSEYGEVVRKIIRAGIPVMGHIGLTPQSVHKLGGFVVQGRDAETAARIVDDAVALEQAGAYSIVLEGIPLELAKTIASKVQIPTIGIGAGIHCDGQVLVCYDLLGLIPSFKPRFVKRYATMYEQSVAAMRTFFDEVRLGTFPDEEHSFRAASMRLVKGEAAAGSEPEERTTGVYGVPV